jgi:hypothetical protein
MKTLTICALAAALFTTGATGHSSRSPEKSVALNHDVAEVTAGSTNAIWGHETVGSLRESYATYITPLPPI